jgi:hypothetical protein
MKFEAISPRQAAAFAELTHELIPGTDSRRSCMDAPRQVMGKRRCMMGDRDAENDIAGRVGSTTKG